MDGRGNCWDAGEKEDNIWLENVKKVKNRKKASEKIMINIGFGLKGI
jgi:hypothetical protein